MSFSIKTLAFLMVVSCFSLEVSGAKKIGFKLANETAGCSWRCAAITGICAAVCACDYPACECCAECASCMGDLWEECCNCVGLCEIRKNKHKISLSNSVEIMKYLPAVPERKNSNYILKSKTKDSVCYIYKGSAEELSRLEALGCDSNACTYCSLACQDDPGYPYMCCYGSSCCCYRAPGACNIDPACPMNGCG